MKTDEDKGEYVTQRELDDAKEMMGAGYEHKVKDESNDHKYFIITPRIVKAFSRNPYDLALWDTVKDISMITTKRTLFLAKIIFLVACSAKNFIAQ